MHLGIPTWLSGLVNDSQQPPTESIDHPAKMSSVREQTLAHLHDIWLDDIAKQKHILRAAQAKGYALEPNDFTRPFPGSSTTVNMNQSGGGTLAKLLGPLLMMAGGTGATLGGLFLMNQQRQPTPSPAPLPVTQPQAADAGARVRVFWDDVEIKPGQAASADVNKKG